MRKIYVTTPARISLYGGSTDLAAYSDEFSGFAVNLAISLKTHVTLAMCQNGQPNHYPLDADPALFDHILTSHGLMNTVEITSRFDGEIGCGLGTSASASVALLAAITAYRKKRINLKLIAQKAWDNENNQLHQMCGKQDQLAAAFGGGNGWIFGTDKKVKQLIIPKGDITYIYPYMLLVYIGGKRDSHKIQSGLSTLTSEQVAYLNDIKSIAYEGYKAILQKDIHKITETMRFSWVLKKKSNNVTNDRINTIYDTARQHGAMAGKVLGAGQGGYFLFLTEDKQEVMNHLMNLDCIEVPFKISYKGLSVKIID